MLDCAERSLFGRFVGSSARYVVRDCWRCSFVSSLRELNRANLALDLAGFGCFGCLEAGGES